MFEYSFFNVLHWGVKKRTPGYKALLRKLTAVGPYITLYMTRTKGVEYKYFEYKLLRYTDLFDHADAHAENDLSATMFSSKSRFAHCHIVLPGKAPLNEELKDGIGHRLIHLYVRQ